MHVREAISRNIRTIRKSLQGAKPPSDIPLPPPPAPPKGEALRYRPHHLSRERFYKPKMVHAYALGRQP